MNLTEFRRVSADFRLNSLVRTHQADLLSNDEPGGDQLAHREQTVQNRAVLLAHSASICRVPPYRFGDSNIAKNEKMNKKKARAVAKASTKSGWIEVFSFHLRPPFRVFSGAPDSALCQPRVEVIADVLYRRHLLFELITPFTD